MTIAQEYVTTAQAARILGAQVVTVSHMCSSGRLPAEQIAYRWLIPRQALEEFAKTYVPKVGRPRQKRKYTRRSEVWKRK